jgi:phytoene dehydrogenase-like protein
VLVVEQGAALGGYVHAFQRGPYTFDPGVHRTFEGQPGGLPDGILSYLGVRDRVEYVQTGSNYKAVWPDAEIHSPQDLEQHIEAHVRLFPREEEGIRAFFGACQAVHLENHQLPPQIGLAGLDEAGKRFPTLFKYLRATVEEVLDEYLEDARLKSMCAVMWPHLGVPPSRLSFVTYSIAINISLIGTWYVRGTFQSLVDAFGAAIELHGGESVTDRRVTRILQAGNRVSGVELEGGETLRAPLVISNADVRQTFEELLDPESISPKFINRLRRMRPSCSAVVVQAATTLDVSGEDLASEVFRPLGYDADAEWEGIAQGKPGGMWAAFPTREDPSLAPPGEHIAVLTSLAAYDIGRPWADASEAFADRMLDEFELVLPGLRDSLTYSETATPETFYRYALNQNGAIYGWENTPNQTGGRRSPHQTPVEGLFLAGHWTQPGTASLRVIVSGLHAAQMALVSTGSPPLDFGHGDAPPV